MILSKAWERLSDSTGRSAWQFAGSGILLTCVLKILALPAKYFWKQDKIFLKLF